MDVLWYYHRFIILIYNTEFVSLKLECIKTIKRHIDI